MGIPTSAIGTIGEDRFFEILTAMSGGQFACYPPRVDMEGNDVLVKRRHKAGTLAVQVKMREYRDQYGNLTLAIEAADLPDEDPKLIVLFDYVAARAELGDFCWVIPDGVFRHGATLTQGKYEATFSRKATAVGRWVDYRYNWADLPWVIGWYLDEAAKVPPARLTLGSPPPRGQRRAGKRAALPSRSSRRR